MIIVFFDWKQADCFNRVVTQRLAQRFKENFVLLRAILCETLYLNFRDGKKLCNRFIQGYP